MKRNLIAAAFTALAVLFALASFTGGTARAATEQGLTLWWVVFNNPAGCIDGCNGADLFLAGDPASTCVAHASGTVTSEGGATLVGSAYKTMANGDPCLLGTGGFSNPMGAEVHLVVQAHGAPGDVVAQITTFLGGCNPDCADVQFAVHLPGASHSVGNVYWWADPASNLEVVGFDAEGAEDAAGTPVDGASSTLSRTANSITATVFTSVDN